MSINLTPIKKLTSRIDTLNDSHAGLISSQRILESRIERIQDELETRAETGRYLSDKRPKTALKQELRTLLQELQTNISESAKVAQQMLSGYEDFATGDITILNSEVA